MDEVDTLKALCEAGLKSKSFDHTEVRRALVWLNSHPWYLLNATEVELEKVRQKWDALQKRAARYRAFEVGFEARYKREYNKRLGVLREVHNLNTAKALAGEVKEVQRLHRAFVAFKKARHDYEGAAEVTKVQYHLMKAKAEGRLQSDQGG